MTQSAVESETVSDDVARSGRAPCAPSRPRKVCSARQMEARFSQTTARFPRWAGDGRGIGDGRGLAAGSLACSRLLLTHPGVRGQNQRTLPAVTQLFCSSLRNLSHPGVTEVGTCENCWEKM